MAAATKKLAVRAALLVTWLTSGIQAAEEETSHGAVERSLRHNLMSGYHKDVRPVKRRATPTNVSVGLAVTTYELDEVTEILDLKVWLRLRWVDENLQWNAADYSNITKLKFWPEALWTPDIMVYNSVTGHDVEFIGRTKLIVSSDGKIIWVPPASLQVRCSVDVTDWPKETADCQVKLGSWTYDGWALNLTLKENMTFPTPDREHIWTVVSMSSKQSTTYYNCCPEPYHDINYKIQFEKVLSFSYLYYTPVTAAIVLTLAMFVLPVSSSEKLVLGSLNVFLLYMSLMILPMELPRKATGVPNLIRLYYAVFGSDVAALFLSSVILAVCHSHWVSPPPAFLSLISSGHVKRILCLECNKEQRISPSRLSVDDTDEIPLDHNQPSAATSDVNSPWVCLAVVVNRICLILYAVLFVILAALYI